MYALLYRSRERSGLQASDLNAIIDTAKETNRKLDITGLLLSGHMEVIPGAPGEFVQWLEGPKEAVENLYSKIEGDGRHSEIEVLARGPLDEIFASSRLEADIEGDRLFPDWSMALVHLAELPATRDGFLRFALDWDGELRSRTA